MLLSPWPLSRLLLARILEDRISDRFVAERVWERLGYQAQGEGLLMMRNGGRAGLPPSALKSAPMKA